MGVCCACRTPALRVLGGVKAGACACVGALARVCVRVHGRVCARVRVCARGRVCARVRRCSARRSVRPYVRMLCVLESVYCYDTSVR